MHARAFVPLCFALFGLCAPAADWPQWRGPARDGTTPEQDWTADWPKEGPKRLWKADVGIGCSSVVVSGGRLFTMGNIKDPPPDASAKPLEKDVIWCLNAESGEVVWKREYPCPCAPSGYEGGPTSTPCVDGDRVYAQSKTGLVFCLEAATGKLVWQYTPEKLANTIWGGIASSPVVAGNLVISCGMAFDKATGSLAWRAKGAGNWSSPQVTTFQGKPAVVLFGAGLSFLSPDDGKILTSLPWPSEQNVSDPIIFDGKAFISSRRTQKVGEQCALVNLASEQPEVVWTNGVLPSYFFTRVKLGGFVYGTDEQSLKCVDLATGTLKWEAKGLGRGQIVAADSKLILAVGGSIVVAEASPDGFKQLARVSIAGGGTSVAPALANGRLFFRSAKGELVCLDVKKP